MPWPVRRGGIALAIYSHSLSIALFGLFALSFVLHALGGMMAHNSDARQHGEASVGLFEYVQTSRFWFESFQNWQSEFLSIGTMIVLAIFLRQRARPSLSQWIPHTPKWPQANRRIVVRELLANTPAEVYFEE